LGVETDMIGAVPRRWIIGILALAPVAAEAQFTGPEAPIALLDQGLVQVMQAGRRTPFAQRMAVMTPIIQGVFALPTILRLTVGPSFASFPPADQAQLLQAFTEFTAASWVANFDAFNGDRFDISPQTRAVGNDQVVRTDIVSAKGTSTRLDYVMRQFPDSWQAVDVLVDGTISRVAVQRSDFRSLLSAGSALPLIRALRQRTAQLASGNSS